MKKVTYTELSDNGPLFYVIALVFIGVMLSALLSAFYMEHNGHIVTGMTNQVVWGMPHVFAIFLIVAASGALNIASVGTVFGKPVYKPLGRLSGLLAIALLVGGLLVLVLDLGRPDRLIVAMTRYNFKSIFAWNIFLYVGFILVVATYLWLQMERRMNRFAKTAGLVAFAWRLILTTGTGCIFGFLVAREAYDAAIMAPLFIAMSFSYGLATYILVLLIACVGNGREVGDVVVRKLGRLLGVFVIAVLYFTAMQHVTNLYAAEHIGVERFILLDGGIYTALFWLGQVLLGGLVPLLLVYLTPTADTQKYRLFVILASLLVIIGGFAQLYVIVIGGQAYPLNLFPGMEVSSGFYDGVVSAYVPGLAELVLGFGGVALAGFIVLIGLRVLRILPASLASADIDPHHKPTEEMA